MPRRSSSCEALGKLREPSLVVELAPDKLYGFDQRPREDLIVDEQIPHREELTENRVSTDVLVGGPRSLHTSST